MNNNNISSNNCTKYIIGNWKMNGQWIQNAELMSQLKNNTAENLNCNIVICPPYPYLIQAKGLFANTHITYGAQDVSAYDKGAYTGEISAAMLKDLGCTYTIIGHSERRIYHNETDALIAEKIITSLTYDLQPIFCLGETLEQRQNNQTEEIIQKQLVNVLDIILQSKQAAHMHKIIIAYEPVWAIGTGLNASPTQAQAVHKFIRNTCQTFNLNNISILYGGSVKPDNAAELFSMPDINGGLIGGASLNAADFIAIINALPN
jgi:triosephosphate isomerase (TIM)